MDITISDLNDPFFESIYYNFNFKVLSAMIASMNGFDSNGVPNYYGLVKFRNNANEAYKSGWIMKFESRKPDNKGFGTLKLLKSLHTLILSVVSFTDCTIEGTSDGSVILSGTGGTEPYQYKIDSGSYDTDTEFDGLSSGTHTFTIKDSTGATDTVTQVIKEPHVSKGNDISVSYLINQSGNSNITVYPLTLATTSALVDSGDGTSWASIINGSSATGNFTLTVKSTSQNSGSQRSCIVRISSASTNDIDVTFTQETPSASYVLNANSFVNVNFDSFADSGDNVSWGNTTPYNNPKARNLLGRVLGSDDQVKIVITDFAGTNFNVKLVTSAFADASDPVVITGSGTYYLPATAADVAYVQIYLNGALIISGSFVYEIYYSS